MEILWRKDFKGKHGVSRVIQVQVKYLLKFSQEANNEFTV